VSSFQQALAADPQQPLTFDRGVEAVYVDVFVTKDGQPVTGLTAPAFELRDGNVARPVELVAVEALPLTAILAFDTSASVEGEKLVALRRASEAFLDGLRPEDEIALAEGFAQAAPSRRSASSDWCQRRMLSGIAGGVASARPMAASTAAVGTLPSRPRKSALTRPIACTRPATSKRCSNQHHFSSQAAIRVQSSKRWKG
jgi:hypothetical protein